MIEEIRHWQYHLGLLFLFLANVNFFYPCFYFFCWLNQSTLGISSKILLKLTTACFPNGKPNIRLLSILSFFLHFALLNSPAQFCALFWWNLSQNEVHGNFVINFKESRISHFCLSRCTCYIQCLPWSFGRVGLERNTAQVRITNQKGTLSRPNTNILIIKMIHYF